MVDPALLRHIRKYREQFSDDQIYEALIRDGHKPEDLQAAFQLADSTPEGPTPKRFGGWKLRLAVLILGAAGVFVFMRSSKPRGQPAPGPADIASALSEGVEGYRPPPLQPPDLVDAYLPRQSEGNAAEHYLKAGELYMRLGRPEITEAALAGELAPVLAAVESGIGKKRYEALGVLRTPAAAREYQETLAAMVPASMFCSVLGKRADGFSQQGDPSRAYGEVQKMLALGYHHMQSWYLFLQSPQGNNCMMTALLRMRLVLEAQGRDTPEERQRLGRLAQQVLAYTADQKECEAILDIVQRPERFGSLDKYLEQAPLHRPYLNTVFTGVAYGWNEAEAKGGAPDPARSAFLTKASGHADPRVAALANGHLSQLKELQGFLGQVPADERWMTTKGLWKMLQGLKE